MNMNEPAETRASYLNEDLEYHVERLKPDVRVARLTGVASLRSYGTVPSLLGSRIVASFNACREVRNPENLPNLFKALTALFEAKPSEHARAIDRLWNATVAAGVLTDED